MRDLMHNNGQNKRKDRDADKLKGREFIIKHAVKYIIKRVCAIFNVEKLVVISVNLKLGKRW